MGSVIYERAYYHCCHCHTGHFPTDHEFRIDEHQSPGAGEVIALAGVLHPFEEVAEGPLPRLSGLHVSASTVQRTTERIGQDVAQRRSVGETFGPDVPWDWNRDAQGKTVAYIGLDATGVRQQGPHGEKAEGRMPWVATVFNPQPTQERRRRRIWDSRYVAGLMSLAEIGQQLRRECQAVGVDQAQRVIALTDGGNGLENCLTDTVAGRCEELIFILDFRHASEHLQEFAKVMIPNEQERENQVDAWCHRLKQEGGPELLAELQRLDLSASTPLIKESHRLLIGYFQKNQHRMDYPTYVKNGWQIGSGKIESACKSVVALRLKGPGMRWHEPGTHALCQLRALNKSQPECWRSYWKTKAIT